MKIKKIKLLNFRNYETLSLDRIFPGINVIYGKNAQGKTNLIEAIHICANGKSFRTNNDAKTVRFSCDSAYLKTEYEKKGRTHTMEVLIGPDRKKSFKKNGIPVKSIRDMLGDLYAVIFSPEDIRTVKESPSLRRAFLDGEISKIRPSYVDALKQYANIISQKNAALRRRKTEDLKGVIRAFNQPLQEYIKIILKNRRMYLNKLNEYVDQTHRSISGGEEKIEIRYRPTLREEKIGEQLEQLIEKEIDDFGCAAGPHRDDIEIRINDRDVRQFASQGQLRTLMLAVKIACLKILQDSTGETPVLLLDDVFAELDETRKANLLGCLKGVQVFLTTADETDAEKLGKTAQIEVKSGTIVTKN